MEPFSVIFRRNNLLVPYVARALIRAATAADEDETNAVNRPHHEEPAEETKRCVCRKLLINGLNDVMNYTMPTHRNNLHNRISVLGLSMRFLRLRYVLSILVFICAFGLYNNLRFALDESSLSVFSRQVSKAYMQGLPEEMMHQLVLERDGDNTFGSASMALENEAKHSFSACLLVKDDNHWLIEWLAYHYHVLPLRHLIIMKDPQSVTSPTKILDRWRSRMIVEEWTDNDFLPDWILRKASQTNVSGLWLHLNRQNFFYASCLQSLYQQNRSLVTLTDTDEFIRINPYRHKLSAQVRKQPGHILTFLQKRKNQIGNIPCYLLPRIQVSTVEKPRRRFPLFRYPDGSIPQHFNASDFLTLRYLYHNEIEMDAGKNIINLKYFNNISDLPAKRTESVHHALVSCPNKTANMIHAKDTHLQIQHYLGTFEQFSYRDDPRDAIHDRWRNWYTRGRTPEPRKRDSHTVSWLSGFVERQGLETAMKLLENVGKLEPRIDADFRDRFKAGPPPPPANFSSCLIVKDDNHWLIEWLAFHYHVLPLRELIVMVDPTSTTSPNEIFERWKGKINIETWRDESVIPSHIFKKVETGVIDQAHLHRHRQQFFYGHCLRAFHQRNASWVFLGDTDEFVVPNPYSNSSHRVVHSLKKPGAIRKILQSKIKSKRTKDSTFAPACLLLPRMQITSQLPADPVVIEQRIPRGFSGDNFLTTKWLYHNGHEVKTGHNLDGKNIINLENLEYDQIPPKVKNVHHALPEICPVSDGNRATNPDTWLWIYHYMGSLEQYTFRDDPRDQIRGRPRRNETLWKRVGRQGGDGTLREDAFAIREWLEGFVESVGWFEARRLLKNVGKTGRLSVWDGFFG